MLTWLRHQEKNSQTTDDEPWTLHRPDLSLAIWKAMEATQWRHLPFTGNLLDQPDWWIHDAFTLAWRKSVLREQMKSPLAEHGIKPRVAFGG